MGLMKKLTSVVVTAGLLLGLVGTAAAAYPDGVAAAAGRMHDLGLVNGKVQGSSDLQLNDPITRAELVTIIVRAFGKANDAKFLKGAAAFPDTASHWASGEIALAKNMIEANGFSMGMPDGTFAPDAKLTTAQAVAFVMKFLGAPRDASQAWPNDYLNGAVAAGLMSADDKAALEAVANNDANRGLAFYLADEAFYSYKMADGKTVYTEFVKPTAPTVTLDEVAPTTKATATVSGSVSSDATAVYVGSMANQVTVTAGKFSADVDLTMGDNNISVMATDLAGNTTTKTLTITRTVGAAASIDAPATLTVKAGDTVDLAAAVKDADGNTISDAVLTATGDAGTLADGKFTAATKAGSYTLTLTSGDLTATVAVTVTAGDIASIAVTPATVNLAAGAVQKFAAAGVDQYGNSVDLSTVTWSASAGVIDQSGNFAGTGAGNITVTATSGESSGTATATVYGVAAALKVAVSGNLTADASSTATATVTAVDANGNPVPNATNTVDLLSSNTGVFTVAPAEVALVNGQATVTLTDVTTTGNTAYLSVTSTGLTSASSLVTATGQTLGSIQLVVDPGTMGLGSTNHATITAKALDTNGKSMKAPVTLAVTLTSSNTNVATLAGGSNVQIAATYSSGSTAATNLTAGNVPGSATISGVVTTTGYTNIPVTSATINTTYIGNVGYQLSFDAISQATVSNSTSSYQTLKVHVQDYNGNQVTADNATQVTFVETSGDVQFSSSSTFGSTSTRTITVTAVNGLAKVYARSTTSGDYTYKAFATNLGTVSATGNFKWGAASAVYAAAVRPATLANDGNSTSKMTFYIVDQFGNTVEDSTAAVTFARTSTNTAVTSIVGSTTANASAGVVSFNVQAGTNVGGPNTYDATSVGLTDSSALSVSTTNVGAAFKLAQYYVYNGGSWTAGDTNTVRVSVQDYSSNMVTSDAGRSVTLSVVTGSAEIATPTVATSNGYVAFSVKATTAGTLVLRATTTGLNVNTVDTQSITVSPAWPTKLAVSASPTTLANDGLSNVGVTVYTTDDFGNKSSVSTGTVTANLSVDSNTIGGFSASSGGTRGTSTTATISNGTYTGTSALAFYSTGVIGSATITASAPGFESSTLTMNTSNVGAATRLAVGTISDKSAYTLVDTTPADNIADASGNEWLSNSTLRDPRVQSMSVMVVDNAGLQVTNGASGKTIRFTPDKNVWVQFQNYATGFSSTAADWEKIGPTGAATYADFTTGASGSVTIRIISPNAGYVNYDLSDRTTGLPGLVASGNFTTGVATSLIAEAITSPIAANGTSQSLIRVRVVDDNGNTVTSYNGTANLQITGPGDLASSTVSIASGVGTVYVTSRAAAGTVTVTPSIAGLTGSVTAATVTVGTAPVMTGTDAGPYRIASGNAAAYLRATAAGPYALSNGDTLTITETDRTVPATPTTETKTITVNAFATQNKGAALTFNADPLIGLDLSASAVADRTITVGFNGGTAVLTVPARHYTDINDLVSALQYQQTQVGATSQFTISAGTGADANKVIITSTKLGSNATASITAGATGVLGWTGGPNAGTQLGASNVMDVSAVTAAELATLVTGAGPTTFVAASGNGLELTSNGTGTSFSLSISGSLASKFPVTSDTGRAENDKFTITVLGQTFALTLTAGYYADAAAMKTQINTQLGATGQAFVVASASTDGKVVLTGQQAGGSVTIKTAAVTFSAYSELGFTADGTATGE